MGLPSVSFSTWLALFAPRNVSKEIVGRLNAAAVEALANQTLRSRLVELGYEVYPRSAKPGKRWPPSGKPMRRNGTKPE
jgi:tripartite-type tricarboxylate transporter receptor subunit TctC